MSADKYPSIFSRQMDTIVYLFGENDPLRLLPSVKRELATDHVFENCTCSNAPTIMKKEYLFLRRR